MKNTFYLCLAVVMVMMSPLMSETAEWVDPADKGVYQWSVAITNLWSSNYDGHYNPRAYLWIPEKCSRLKGVVLANDNMLEEPLFANDGFRKTLAEADCGIVFVSCGYAGMNNGITNDLQAATIEKSLCDLAEVSGYTELAKETKLVPLGHSAWSGWPYYVAERWPERTACGVSFKGRWSREELLRTKNRPMLLVCGEYEDFKLEKKDKLLQSFEGAPVDLRIECDWGSGHFEFTPEMGMFLARYIRDGVQERGKSAKLGGDWPRDAFTARKFTVLGFRDGEGKEVEQNPKCHLQVTLPDLKVDPVFAAKVPPNRPERWTGLKAGEDNPKPAEKSAEKKIDWFVVQGPGVKKSDGSLDIVFNRHGFAGYRAREIVLAAFYPGDDEFKRSVQQAIVRFPHRAKEGKVVHPTGRYVREGAATITDEGELKLLPLPPRAKRPAKVTLCEYARQPDGNLVHELKEIER